MNGNTRVAEKIPSSSLFDLHCAYVLSIQLTKKVYAPHFTFFFKKGK